ncbi:MAG: TIGR00730 family Rossman fold protein [Fibrobacteres bacterium]|nr:TIGR00730 family Rossman fold protein [Fibrobacterota bacterium]
MNLKSIAVYCGSSPGLLPEYATVAEELGKFLAKNSITLVYGGSSVGLMKIVADNVLQGGGKVIGVIPEAIAKKVVHPNLTELHITADMHARKKMMFDLADAFIAMPGGIGTLEEIFEVLTWSQLGFHSKPCAFLNIAGYYHKLFDFLKHSVDHRFVKQEHLDMFQISNTVEGVMDALKTYKPKIFDKWIDRK